MSHDISDNWKEFLFLLQNENSMKQKKRYDTVLLHAERYLPRNISKDLHIPPPTIYNHICAYHKEGLSGLIIEYGLIDTKL